MFIKSITGIVSLVVTAGLCANAFANSDCSDFDCTIYSNWKGGCETSTCLVYRCEWVNGSCTFGDPRPPSSEGTDCGSQGLKLCFKVPVIYKKRTAGEALDKALQRNDAHAASACHNGFHTSRIGKIDVNVISLPNGSVNGPIENVEVRQDYVCGPW